MDTKVTKVTEVTEGTEASEATHIMNLTDSLRTCLPVVLLACCPAPTLALRSLRSRQSP